MSYGWRCQTSGHMRTMGEGKSQIGKILRTSFMDGPLGEFLHCASTLMILFSSLSMSTSCWVTNFRNSFCINSIAASRTFVARHFYFPKMMRFDEYLIGSNTKKHFKIFGMKYSYVLGTILSNCSQNVNFDNISNFFVIYDHLWTFCTTNYMKRYQKYSKCSRMMLH